MKKKKVIKNTYLSRKLSELNAAEKKDFADRLAKVICKGLFNSEDINLFPSFIRDVHRNKTSFKDGIGNFDSASVKSFISTLLKYNGNQLDERAEKKY